MNPGTVSNLCVIALTGLALIGGDAQARRNPLSTVASVAETNGLSANGYFQVRTPSILRLEPAPPIPADARAAIAQYDRVVALSADAVDPELRAEALRRSADLRVQLADADASPDQGFHVAEVRRAIGAYQTALSEFPAHYNNDRVLYQLARAHQLLGEVEPAIARLRELGTRYPQSARAADAYFRSGEMLFAAGRYREAEPAYAGLIALGPEAPFYEVAEYKYGWTLYKQSIFDQAATVFLGILDRDLPAGAPEDAVTALAAVQPDRAERAREALRVVGLSFAALGGGPSVNQHFAQSATASRLETLIYASLAEALLERQRYTDAAGTYTAFIERHPDHRRAPEFQNRAISALRAGGFNEPSVRAQETYVSLYAPGAAYWQRRVADETQKSDVMAEVRRHLDELGRWYQAGAQQVTEPAPRQAGFLAAAGWYRRTLELFPEDGRAPDTRMLLGDALLEGGRIHEAAGEYERTAYGMGSHARAPVAALAATQAWQRLTRETADSAQADARRGAIAAGLKLADTFATHPQRSQVLMAAAEDQYTLRDLDAAITSAERVLQAQPAPELRRGALGVVADARYAQKKYPEAEAAYLQLVQLPGQTEERRRLSVEQLAASVYQQAEAARAAGDLRLAAGHFERVARVAPESSIRSAADYDAASALLALEDWARASTSLEAFRARYAEHRLLADVDKKLALAYEKNQKPALAAEALVRIALREVELPEIRREAAWTSATLYDQARLPALSLRAYLYYVASYPRPLDPAMQARQRLAQLALSEQRDERAHRHWLDQMVMADDSAGAARSALSRRLGAEANLEIGRIDAGAARVLALGTPLDRSLAQRKTATATAVDRLERAAAYGYADITSEASYELAGVYRDLGQAVMRSSLPPQLSGEALEQYRLLLEEQAFPFEEKAIAAHEANLSRLQQGLWNDAIRRSVLALGDLSPAKYGKQERRETSYDQLH